MHRYEKSGTCIARVYLPTCLNDYAKCGVAVKSCRRHAALRWSSTSTDDELHGVGKIDELLITVLELGLALMIAFYPLFAPPQIPSAGMCSEILR